jgi:Phage tail lysozyme
VIPARIEGSAETTPTRAQNFAGVTTDFTLEQIMLRPNPGGPRLPGVGLAQWTSATRRAGVFVHVYNGRAYAADVLRSMDAQLDYLMNELRTVFPGVFAVVTGTNVTVDRASDEVVYNFEVPGAILSGGQKLPRTDPQVQAVFTRRRTASRRARTAFVG